MRLGLVVARVASAAWIGAAALFVVAALREVTHPEFDTATKDALALLRFPAYYGFGFTLVPVAIGGGLVAMCSGRPDARNPTTAKISRPGLKRRVRTAVVLLVVSLVVMIADYIAVYRPIASMITPPGRTKAAEFQSLHRASIWLNVCDVGLCAVAAVLLSWPDPNNHTT
jgi:hypothetical protein